MIKLAYYTYVAYIPRHDSNWPTLIIELKWNKSAEGAIDQILHKKYANAVENFGAKILLVGINDDKDASPDQRRHKCRIVEYRVE